MTLLYQANIRMATVMSCVNVAHSQGDHIDILISNKLQDSYNTIPSNQFDKNGFIKLNISSQAIGDIFSLFTCMCISVQTAFNGRRTEITIPIGSIVSIAIDNELIWQNDLVFKYHTEPVEETLPTNVVPLFKRK